MADQSNGVHISPSKDQLSATQLQQQWIVHKFGGTSVATAECYRNAADIILSIDTDIHTRKCVVVSAMGDIKPNSLVTQLIQKQNRLRGISDHNGNNPVPKKTGDKVTNLLIKCTEYAAAQNNQYLIVFNELKLRHINVSNELLSVDPWDTNNHVIQELVSKYRTELKLALDSDFNDFSYILRSVWLSRSYDVDRAWWFGYGELWSARLFATYLNYRDQLREIKELNNNSQPSTFLDARDVLILQPNKDTIPDYIVSTNKLFSWLNNSVNNSNAKIVVVTGYLATSSSGHPTTLGRDGSDYSASIFASLLNARDCTIWTDVDGVYSANPAQVNEAVIVDELSYDEASELAYFGAKVIHPKTMQPVIKQEIPIWIRNTFNSSHRGSCITSQRKVNSIQRSHIRRLSDADKCVMSYGVKGISEIRNLSLIKVEGTGLIGVPGIAHRLFGSLRTGNCNVVLITQGGSEHSICFAVPYTQSNAAIDAVKHEFRDELDGGDIQNIDSNGPVACLAIVGDGMSGTRGVAGRFFAALADAGCNIMAIAQGSSERNISVIIEQKHVTIGLEHAHRAFLRPRKLDDSTYSPLLRPARASLTHRDDLTNSAPLTSDSLLSQVNDMKLSSGLFDDALRADKLKQSKLWCSTITLNICIISGYWELALIHQLISRLSGKLGERKSVRVRVVALVKTNDNTMLLNNIANNKSYNDASLSTIQLDYLTQSKVDHSQPLDLTILQQYMQQCIDNSTDNYSVLIDCSDNELIYRSYPVWTASGLRVITQQRQGCLINDMTSVPLIPTIHNILSSGDHITHIEAILPSPLAFLFLQPNSKLIDNLDFSRCECVRSLTGIAWQLGYHVQPSDVMLQVDTLKNLTHPADVQAEVNRLISQAQKTNKLPRYIAALTINDQSNISLSVGIRNVTQSHPFYWVRGRNTIIIIHTQKLSPDPIVLQAPVPNDSKANQNISTSTTSSSKPSDDITPCDRASLQLVLGQFNALVSNLSS